MNTPHLEAGEKAGEKRCNRCRAVKSVEDFYRSNASRDGRQYECKACTKERLAGKADQRRDAAWRHALRVKFGMSDLDYQELLNAQDEVCAICREACMSGNRLAVDHNHVSGEIRGLLCRNCNVGLGLFRDDLDRLRSALTYLEG